MKAIIVMLLALCANGFADGLKKDHLGGAQLGNGSSGISPEMMQQLQGMDMQSLGQRFGQQRSPSSQNSDSQVSEQQLKEMLEALGEYRKQIENRNHLLKEFLKEE